MISGTGPQDGGSKGPGPSQIGDLPTLSWHQFKPYVPVAERVVSWLRSPALVTAAVASARIVPRLAARIVPLFVGAGARGGAA